MEHRSSQQQQHTVVQHHTGQVGWREAFNDSQPVLHPSCPETISAAASLQHGSLHEQHLRFSKTQRRQVEHQGPTPHTISAAVQVRRHSSPSSCTMQTGKSTSSTYTRIQCRSLTTRTAFSQSPNTRAHRRGMRFTNTEMLYGQAHTGEHDEKIDKLEGNRLKRRHKEMNGHFHFSSPHHMCMM